MTYLGGGLRARLSVASWIFVHATLLAVTAFYAFVALALYAEAPMPCWLESVQSWAARGCTMKLLHSEASLGVATNLCWGCAASALMSAIVNAAGPSGQHALRGRHALLCLLVLCSSATVVYFYVFGAADFIWAKVAFLTTAAAFVISWLRREKLAICGMHGRLALATVMASISAALVFPFVVVHVVQAHVPEIVDRDLIASIPTLELTGNAKHTRGDIRSSRTLVAFVDPTCWWSQNLVEQVRQIPADADLYVILRPVSLVRDPHVLEQLARIDGVASEEEFAAGFREITTPNTVENRVTASSEARLSTDQQLANRLQLKVTPAMILIERGTARVVHKSSAVMFYARARS